MVDERIRRRSSIVEFRRAAQQLAVAAEVLMRDVDVPYRRRKRYRVVVRLAQEVYRETKLVEKKRVARPCRIIDDSDFHQRIELYAEKR